MKRHKLGMRTVKTALAVSITMVIANLMSLTNPFFAAIAAILCMESSVSESFSAAKDRMLGTIIGAFIAILFVQLLPINFITMGLGVLTVIYFTNIITLQNTIKISTIVFIAILLRDETINSFSYALYRTFDTFIGLFVGTVVNYFVLPHKVGDRIHDSLEMLYQASKSLLRDIIWRKEVNDLHLLATELVHIEDQHKILKKELKLNVYEESQAKNYLESFQRFDLLYNHLSILASLENTHTLTAENRKALVKFFEDCPPIGKEKEGTTLNIVFNYHLEEALKELKAIEVIRRRNS